MNSPTAVVVGVGPGLGRSLSMRFAREGFAVAMMSRSPDSLEPFQTEIEEEGGTARSIPCDATRESSVHRAFESVRKQLRSPDVLIYNAGAFEKNSILDIEPDSFVECWEANCLGGFLTSREVLPSMVDRGEGTIVFTGATGSLRGSAEFANLAVGKFGLRALAQSMARELGPAGIHVAHVIIDGQIRTPRNVDRHPQRKDHTFLDPDAIADAYWQLHEQDRSAWTLELDLRPHVEEF